MHIPDGFLDLKTALTTAIASTGGLGYAVKEVRKKLGDKHIPLLGVTSAFIFAAQMLNFPVAGGTSGHFLGGALAAILLGPWASLLIMTVVLVIQCLGFADGGLTALGANVFNMGIIGGVFTYYFIFIPLKKALSKTKRGFLTASAIAAWASVFIASIICSLELAISGTSPLNLALPAMAGVHALIGIGEAIVTVVVLAIVIQIRPDLIGEYSESEEET
ncbi:MAG: energy-coupling factor ABC transporter permease [Actinomycetia bacterium]|nr:energy-coupling factor ABC transporter permease [Actinomycetes bacterium]